MRWMDARGCSKNEALSHPPHLQLGGRKVAVVTGCLCSTEEEAARSKNPYRCLQRTGVDFRRGRRPPPLFLCCSKRDTSADKGEEEDAAASEEPGQLSRRNRSLITPLTKTALTAPPLPPLPRPFLKREENVTQMMPPDAPFLSPFRSSTIFAFSFFLDDDPFLLFPFFFFALVMHHRF